MYLCEHFISFIEVIKQYGDLGFIRTPGQELAKSSLHALHFGSFESGNTTLADSFTSSLHEATSQASKTTEEVRVIYR